MSELVTVAGLVATTPRHLVTQDGLPITSFRLAASHRKFDRALNKWIDGETNWFTVTAFRQLAINVAGSVSKGERILVTGKLRVRDWDNGERAGTSVEIEADSMGHDLCWGNAAFTRTVLVREAADLPDPEVDSPETEEAEEKELALAK
jgi:single-strand DNA-binding protein